MVDAEKILEISRRNLEARKEEIERMEQKFMIEEEMEKKESEMIKQKINAEIEIQQKVNQTLID